MKNKKFLTVCAICVCAVIVLFAFNYNTKTDNIDLSQFEISYIKASTPLFDLSDKSLYVGYSDYVFVGKVENVVYGGKYAKGKYYPNGTITTDNIAIPYTEYEITVIKDIKGNLTEGNTVFVKKHAGIDLSRNILNILQGDIMPNSGEEYIFLVRALPSGDLVTIDPLGNIALNENTNNIVTNNNTTTSVNYIDIITTTTDNTTNFTTSVTNNADTTLYSTSKENIIADYVVAYANEVDPRLKNNS